MEEENVSSSGGLVNLKVGGKRKRAGEDEGDDDASKSECARV